MENENTMLHEVTKIIMKLSELGVTEVSLKSDWRFVSKLEWDIASIWLWV